MRVIRTRNKKFEIRLTEKELAAVKIQIKKSGLSQTDFALAAMLNKTITVIEDMPELIRQLKAIGNNLNQVARATNAGQAIAPPVVTELDMGVKELWRWLRCVRAAVR